VLLLLDSVGEKMLKLEEVVSNQLEAEDCILWRGWRSTC
jgi:hypothetical protein